MFQDLFGIVYQIPGGCHSHPDNPSAPKQLCLFILPGLLQKHFSGFLVRSFNKLLCWTRKACSTCWEYLSKLYIISCLRGGCSSDSKLLKKKHFNFSVKCLAQPDFAGNALTRSLNQSLVGKLSSPATHSHTVGVGNPLGSIRYHPCAKLL